MANNEMAVEQVGDGAASGPTQIGAAQRMMMMHGTSRYTARERAIDHAFGNDPGPTRDWWLGVVREMDALVGKRRRTR